MPYSVTTTSIWCRGVVITAPASNHGTIRLRISPSRVTVEGRHRSERSSIDSPGPETKSSWPPMPENWRPFSTSATTWPWMSIASAPLIVTIARLRAITSGLFTTSTGRNATSWLPASQA